jgi:hypothetical protein
MLFGALVPGSFEVGEFVDDTVAGFPVGLAMIGIFVGGFSTGDADGNPTTGLLLGDMEAGATVTGTFHGELVAGVLIVEDGDGFAVGIVVTGVVGNTMAGVLVFDRIDGLFVCRLNGALVGFLVCDDKVGFPVGAAIEVGWLVEA